MIEVRVDDLAFFEGDAIVRPVNADLGATTPLLRRLERAAGPALLEQIRLHEPLPVGAAVVTSAGALSAGLFVNAVVSSDTEPATRTTVRQALTSAMQRVEGWRMESVAIAPFGLGAGNLAIEESADVMVEVLAAHLRRGRFPRRAAIIAETPDEETVLIAAVRRNGL